MRILYLVEEILPQLADSTRQVFQICQSLANSGCEVHLVCSRGSSDQLRLCQHFYPDQKQCRSFPLYRFWSSKEALMPSHLGRWLFALQAQHLIHALKPHWVISCEPSTLLYHLKRKIGGARYGLEVGPLPFVVGDLPLGQSVDQTAFQKAALNVPQNLRAEVLVWRDALARSDLLIVPTHQIKSALLNAPYAVSRPICTLPLGSSFTPLPPSLGNEESKVKLLFIASSSTTKKELFLLNALRLCTAQDHLHLHIANTTNALAAHLENEISLKGLQNCVTLYGQQTPKKLNMLALQADAFICLADKKSSDALIAHAQLIDFCRLGRPIIAPDLPIILELLPEGQARAFLFASENIPALAIQLRRVADSTLRFLTTSALHQAFEANPHRFSMEQRAHALKIALSSQR